MTKRVKYSLLTAAGVVAFFIANHAATITRGYAAIGGEGFFILLPVIWWVAEKTTKDMREPQNNINGGYNDENSFNSN